MKHKLQYILTWVSLAVLLLSASALIMVSWNSHLQIKSMPSLMISLWSLICASGIYLFMLAVKKAHRSWILHSKQEQKEAVPVSSKASADTKGPDFVATAKKLVRRTPEGSTLESIGHEWLKSLARELEIMSGILYIKKEGVFDPVASYALASSAEPYRFSEGEGLSGQAAKSKQIMVLTHLPEDFLKVYSGLGKALPGYLAIVPLVKELDTVAVLECTGYRYDPHDIETMFRVFSRDIMQKLEIKDH